MSVIFFSKVFEEVADLLIATCVNFDFLIVLTIELSVFNSLELRDEVVSTSLIGANVLNAGFGVTGVTG